MLGLLLLGRAAQLLLVLRLLRLHPLCPAGEDGIAAGVADRVAQGLHLGAAEAEEDRAVGAVLAQVAQSGRDDRERTAKTVAVRAPSRARTSCGASDAHSLIATKLVAPVTTAEQATNSTATKG
ncbi:hypothetical protein ACFWB2_12720 [Streptomyces virginiae]|uniref:hypothetical protein n=1 Tax=Streptomyces virginiae TaxID=1961 RepID=UPI0036BE1526